MLKQMMQVNKITNPLCLMMAILKRNNDSTIY